MSDQHWQDDAFIARLLGVGPEDGHLEACQSCAHRWEMVRRKHEARSSEPVEVPEALLAAQRRAIYARIGGKKRRFHVQLAPSLTFVLLLLVILTALRPIPEKRSEMPLSDTQVFEDIFSIASSSEPGLVGPVRSLFEVQQ